MFAKSCGTRARRGPSSLLRGPGGAARRPHCHPSAPRAGACSAWRRAGRRNRARPGSRSPRSRLCTAAPTCSPVPSGSLSRAGARAGLGGRAHRDQSRARQAASSSGGRGAAERLQGGNGGLHVRAGPPASCPSIGRGRWRGPGPPGAPGSSESANRGGQIAAKRRARVTAAARRATAGSGRAREGGAGGAGAPAPRSTPRRSLSRRR